MIQLEVGDRVRVNAPGEAYHGRLAVVEVLFDWGVQARLPMWRHEKAIDGHEIRLRMLWAELTPAHPPATGGGGGGCQVRPVQPQKVGGFTGDLCPGCGGAKMVRSGSCATCQDCGSTTGCS